MSEALKSSEEQSKEFADYFEIWDPDGWDRSPENFDREWNEFITKEEFFRRVSYSTCKFKKSFFELAETIGFE